MMMRTLFGLFLVVICFFQRVKAETNELIETKAKIEEVRQALSVINEKLQKLKTGDSVEFSPNSNLSDSGDLRPTFPTKPNEVMVKSSQTHEGRRVREMSSFDTSGFYILPFLGLLTSKNLTGQSSILEFEIEEGVGTSHGLSVGYEGKNFFSDFQVSYIQNRMKSIKLPFPVPFPLSFSGKSKALGFHVAGGGRFHLNQYISASIGAGIGGVNQDISFLLGGLHQVEKDFLFSYQLFSGLELHPSKYTKVGLRYRWLNIEEMDSFSSRDLHLLEMYLGYLF